MERPEGISALEWIMSAIGLVLVAGTIGLLLADARTSAPGAPAIVVRVDSVAATSGGFVVHFTARNDGRAAVAAVGITGELRDRARTETARATLDYLPGRSERRGGLAFSTDPRRGELRLRPDGWQEP